MAIEKFEGKLEREESGCTIAVNSTINLIKDASSLGLYIYLICRPPAWELNIKQLMRHFECGRDRVYKSLNYLMEIGLIVKIETREEGQFASNSYRVLLHPRSAPSLHSRSEISPCTEKPDTVNQETYKTKNTSFEVSSNEGRENLLEEPNPEKQNQYPVKEAIDVYHEVLPELPKIRKADQRLKNQIRAMIREWPTFSKDGAKFTLDSFGRFLQAIKDMHPKFLLSYKTREGNRRQNNLRTITRPTNLAKFVNGEFNFN
jgi:hypothetical protein